MTEKSKDIFIAIPARYGSSRLQGKPLLKIRGTEMIKRVASIAERLCLDNPQCEYSVATDDERIMQFCRENGINAAMTSKNCRNGTERCCDLMARLNIAPRLVINLQGDNPLCPPWVIQSLVDEWRSIEADVYTPAVLLDWDEYDRFKESKRETPFSGTSVITDRNGFAMSFSKNIIPAIRKPERARELLKTSPVMRHTGLYAYSYETLVRYAGYEESLLEKDFIEGLEQMRFLYNGLKVKIVLTDYRGRETCSGVDSLQDLKRAEEIIDRFGELTV